MTHWVDMEGLFEETGVPIGTLQHIKANDPGVLTFRRRKGSDRTDEYKQPDCAIALRNRAVAIAKEQAKPKQLDDAKTRRETAEAKMAELELGKMESELVPVGDAAAEVAQFLDRLRAKLLNFPAQWAPLVAQCVGESAIQACLDDGIRDAMTELSKRDD